MSITLDDGTEYNGHLYDCYRCHGQDCMIELVEEGQRGRICLRCRHIWIPRRRVAMKAVPALSQGRPVELCPACGKERQCSFDDGQWHCDCDIKQTRSLKCLSQNSK